MPPERIADELLRIARHPALTVHGGDARSPQPSLGDEDALRALFHQLRAACRIDFSHYKRGTIQRRVARRLALHGADDLAGYQAVLESDPAEVHALCRDLLIRYTEFFRDPEAFDALRQTALPRLLQPGDPDRPLRVWVPGCATGEEVYSIAICIAEYMAEHGLGQPVQIFGTDVSDDALQVARTGRYIENIARSVSAERLARFFVREGDHYRVSKAIRDGCRRSRARTSPTTRRSRGWTSPAAATC
ncbi:MAG: protein-glutamate O-methyltransferase CheR [Comamonadaceae bacterium]|nr:protein-glutamate O-methyltransferase CheR [Comamonadaceae bacterium]